MFNRINITADNRLQRGDCLRRHQSRVDCLLRFGRVTTQAFKLDLQQICCGEKRPRTDCKFAHWSSWPIVHAVYFLDVPTLHHAVFAHFAPTTAAFFGRLENDHNRTVKVARFAQIFGSTQQHRGMPVMPTGMHRPGRFGCIIQTCFFKDRQRVHICTQPNDFARSGFASFDHANNACAANTFDHFFTSKGAQFFSNHRGCTMRFKKDLGVLMQIPTPLRDFVVQFSKSILDRHSSVPPLKINTATRLNTPKTCRNLKGSLAQRNAIEMANR